MKRLTMTPAQAIEFSELDSIVLGAHELACAADRVRASQMPDAYEYVGVTLTGKPTEQEEVRICIRKDL